MSAYIKHCLSKDKYDNEVALACSVNAVFFIHFAGVKKCDSQHVVLRYIVKV